MLALLMFLAAVPDRGELCLRVPNHVRAECRESAGFRVSVEPAAVQREVVWRHAEGTEIAAGFVSAGMSAIDLRDASWRSVELTLQGADPELWPMPVTVRVTTGEHTIETALPAALRVLRVPAAATSIELSAPHHRPSRHELVAGRTRTLLGRVKLIPWPVVSGTIVDKRTAQPIAGATIALPTEEVLATSAGDGRFRAEITRPWPEVLRVSLPGRATELIRLPNAESSVDVGRIALTAGSALRVRITGAEEVDVTVLRRDAATRELAPLGVATEVRGETLFKDLPAGKHVAVLRGRAPLQQLAIEVELVEGETREVVAEIVPLVLTTRVTRSDEAIAGAALTISPTGGEWRAVVRTGADGTHTGELWQQGELVAFVERDALRFMTHDVIRGDGEAEWHIRAPAGRVVGVVIDEEGKPVAGARVMLETSSGDTGGQTGTETSADGRFAFDAVANGKQTVTASAAAFFDATTSFQLRDDEHSVRLTLTRARLQPLIVTGLAGEPLANAAIVDESGVLRDDWKTDAAGTISIPLREGERKTLYVLPRQGSFAVVDVAAPRANQPAQPIRIAVPPAASILLVRARSSEGDPIPGVRVAFRFNGRLLPQPVRLAMLAQQGLPLQTAADGVAALRNVPAGLYELWPYFTNAEARSIAAGLAQPPARIAAAAGESSIVLTFDPRR